MALIDATWQRREQYCWDGVRYDVSIFDFGDGFYQAAWICSSCGEEGVLAPLGMSVEEVLSLSQIGARVHHRLVHLGETAAGSRVNCGSESV
jgi:hypothetical protein